ncbi:hypothetical protein DFJ74DRAFT_707529 [Hyaloraphidium curvatum]|nr:hypothetical protein DFJ74DRAFT_707529 [Hyaloraphidium curvatum]
MSAVPASAGRTTSALGDNIADSVRLAAIDLMTGEALKPGSAIALDVATEAEGLPVESLDKCSFAVDGIALSNRLGKLHFVLPNEFAQTSGLCTLSLGGKATYHVGELQTRLRAQSLEDGALFRFRTRSFILLPSGSIFEQKHGSSFEDIEIAPKRLLEGVTMSADYLVRSMQEDGRWTYVYDAVHNQDLTDTKGAAYNQMRHAGAAYFVADAFARLPRERSYLDAVDKAVAWLWPQLIPMGDFAGQPMASMCVDKGQLSRQVGCTGIVLVALVEWARNKGGVTDEELERMRQLARYIAHQQYPDGHFRKNSDRVAEEGIAPMPEEIEYYNGEAMLGIMRFYSLDRNETWKAVAYKAALWTIEIRDAGKTEETAPNDHWLAYALTFADTTKILGSCGMPC